MWYDGIEDKVVAAFKDKGLRPRSRSFCVDAGACALGALLGPTSRTGAKDWADQLGASPKDDDPHGVWEFIFGFDNGLDFGRAHYSITDADREVSPARAAGLRTALKVKESL